MVTTKLVVQYTQKEMEGTCNVSLKKKTWLNAKDDRNIGNEEHKSYKAYKNK
jgi:hypothetical protein